jgi:hypothetical protein
VGCMSSSLETGCISYRSPAILRSSTNCRLQFLVFSGGASTRADDATTTYLLRQRGIEAYCEMNEVVILDVNMRHRDDPALRDILARWRNGVYTQPDIDLVNRQCYQRNWRCASVTAAKTCCPIFVTANAPRVEFNQLATRAYCKTSQQILRCFSAAVSRQRGDLIPSNAAV